ncbi:MAG: hypothetical protein JWM81_216 [Candidatus Saccharibacteria bacterium]|nr:hypothetical protein [Candidatus Saccharibacteria bacterium]
MRLLRQLFFLKRIYFRQTPLQILYFYFIPLIIATGATFDNGASWHRYAYIADAVLGYFVLRTCLRTYIVASRMRGAPEKQAAYVINSQISSAAVSYELDHVDSLRLLREGPGWKLYDAVFDFFQHTKYGTFLSKQAYYTVYEAQLIRKVPHLIFDSKLAKRRQFKYLYLRSQSLSLEGDFDDYFATYSPQHYQIDTLSFITPEVMQALVALKDYDIEIFDDKVLCYGPLKDAADLDTMEQACQVLCRELNDNLNTYRDDRLLGDDRKHSVAPFARTLLKSPLKYVPVLVLSAIALVALICFSIILTPKVLITSYALLDYVLLGGAIINIQKVVTTNRRAVREYEVLTGPRPKGL